MKNAKKKPILQIQNVSKRYELDGVSVDALKKINVEIYEGEFVAIIGPSGSGKSTLMHIIGALDTPTTGKVIIDGQDISTQKETSLAKIRNQKIGFVFQQFNLLAKTSSIDNVAIPLIYSGKYSKKQRTDMATAMLTRVGLADRLKNFPNQLSGGQQQRVAIARALINEPSIILADEPTGNLDTKTGKEIIKFFHDLNNEGITIILVTHAMDIAQQANRQIMIKDGEIVSKL